MEYLKLTTNIIFRLLVSPLLFVLMIISSLWNWVTTIILFITYGGEWITYRKPRITITDVYEKVEKLVSENNRKEGGK